VIVLQVPDVARDKWSVIDIFVLLGWWNWPSMKKQNAYIIASFVSWLTGRKDKASNSS
jgi:hypothetical protein